MGELPRLALQAGRQGGPEHQEHPEAQGPSVARKRLQTESQGVMRTAGLPFSLAAEGNVTAKEWD